MSSNNSSSSVKAYCCTVCGKTENLLRCARCKASYYCSKQHQRDDWKKHKTQCQIKDVQALKPPVVSTVKSYINKVKSQNSPIPSTGSSEEEILRSGVQTLSPNVEFVSLEKKVATMPISNENLMHPHNFSELCLQPGMAPFLHRNKNSLMEEMCRNVIMDMNSYGLCVLDNFLGEEKGRAVLSEVLDLYTKGVFKDGQLVSSVGKRSDIKNIRGDQIVWLDGKEHNCTNIGHLISQVDTLVTRANRMTNNGQLGLYNINGRTKAMVACYPGSGSHYVTHVDNPNKDGRCITAIYYLNLQWDVHRSGGLLRIFPEGWQGDKVADIEPLFDRLLFFWSDRRNPHEVQPAYHTRYAITLWYFDGTEREEANRRYQIERGRGTAGMPK